MTLILHLGLDIVKMYLHIKMKFVGQGIQKLEHEEDTWVHFLALVTLTLTP